MNPKRHEVTDILWAIQPCVVPRGMNSHLTAYSRESIQGLKAWEEKEEGGKKDIERRGGVARKYREAAGRLSARRSCRLLSLGRSCRLRFLRRSCRLLSLRRSCRLLSLCLLCISLLGVSQTRVVII